MPLNRSAQAGYSFGERAYRFLERAVEAFIISSIEQHIALGCARNHVIILGRGNNVRFFSRLNDKHGWFDQVHALDHPRFIMQYRRKRLDEYLKLYSNLLSGKGPD